MVFRQWFSCSYESKEISLTSIKKESGVVWQRGSQETCFQVFDLFIKYSNCLFCFQHLDSIEDWVKTKTKRECHSFRKIKTKNKNNTVKRNKDKKTFVMEDFGGSGTTLYDPIMLHRCHHAFVQVHRMYRTKNEP